jgi:hypothetical protein
MASRRPNGTRSAEIGRECETAVVSFLVSNGFPHSERRRVQAIDRLDLIVCPGVIASVKGGHRARTASVGDTVLWRAEAIKKCAYQNADVVILVVQRNGYGRDRASAWRTWVLNVGRDGWETSLHTAATYLREIGYGTALEADPTT